jgi:hypothetical protein
MSVLTPVFTQDEKLTLSPAFRLVKSPLKAPAWTVLLVVLLTGATGFLAGRHKPAHHYVSYFGYPMVLDTTTGKACYATKPTPAEAGSAQEAAFPVYDDSNRLDTYVPNGASVPLCGQ